MVLQAADSVTITSVSNGFIIIINVTGVFFFF